MAYVQKSTVVAASGTPFKSTVTLASTVAGNSIIVVVAQSGTGTGRTYTITDGINIYTEVHKVNTANRGIHVFADLIGAGGSLTIVGEPNTGTAGFDMIAFEVNGLASTGTAVYSDMVNTSVLVHPCAAGSGINTLVKSFIVTGTALSGSTSTQTPATNFSGVTGAGTSARYYQYYDAPSTESNLTAAWSATGTARNSDSVIVAFPYNVAAPAALVYPRVRTLGLNARLN